MITNIFLKQEPGYFGVSMGIIPANNMLKIFLVNILAEENQLWFRPLSSVQSNPESLSLSRKQNVVLLVGSDTQKHHPPHKGHTDQSYPLPLISEKPIPRASLCFEQLRVNVQYKRGFDAGNRYCKALNNVPNSSVGSRGFLLQ